MSEDNLEKGFIVRYFILLILVAIVIAAAISLGRKPNDTNTKARENQVVIENMSFSPNRITVGKGTEVKWINRDKVAHTVTSDEHKFDSGNIIPGDSYTHRFDTAGTYTYHCSLHPVMTGVVVVK